MLPIDDMIAPLVRLRNDAAATRFKDTRRHYFGSLSTHLTVLTIDEAEEFHGVKMNGPGVGACRASRRAPKSRKSANDEAFERCGETIVEKFSSDRN
jgi:hypothetical protein